MTAHAGPPPRKFVKKSAECTGDANTSIDCTFFHYVIRNVGDRPVRHGYESCHGIGITTEYRTSDGNWQQLPPDYHHPLVCTSNIFSEIPILPGGAAEGDLMLGTPEYDTSILRTAGDYLLHFTFFPNACVASPDGTFCLTKPEKEEPVNSPEITVHLTNTVSNP